MKTSLKDHFYTSQDFDANYDVRKGPPSKPYSCKVCCFNPDSTCEPAFIQAVQKAEHEIIHQGPHTHHPDAVEMMMCSNPKEFLFKKYGAPAYEKCVLEHPCMGHEKLYETRDKDFVNYLLERGYVVKETLMQGRADGDSSSSSNSSTVKRSGIFSSSEKSVSNSCSKSSYKRSDLTVYILQLKK